MSLTLEAFGQAPHGSYLSTIIDNRSNVVG